MAPATWTAPPHAGVFIDWNLQSHVKRNRPIVQAAVVQSGDADVPQPGHAEWARLAIYAGLRQQASTEAVRVIPAAVVVVILIQPSSGFLVEGLCCLTPKHRMSISLGLYTHGNLPLHLLRLLSLSSPRLPHNPPHLSSDINPLSPHTKQGTYQISTRIGRLGSRHTSSDPQIYVLVRLQTKIHFCSHWLPSFPMQKPFRYRQPSVVIVISFVFHQQFQASEALNVIPGQSFYILQVYMWEADRGRSKWSRTP